MIRNVRGFLAEFLSDVWWGFTHAAQVIREVWRP